MTDTNVKTSSLAPPFWLLGPLSVFCGIAALGLVSAQQAYYPWSTKDVLATLMGAVLCTTLILGPSRIILTLVFLLALLDHQFRSPFILPFGGAEWHPRELLLLLLFLHAAVKLVQYRLWIRWTPLHVAMLLYTAVFAYGAWRGLWLGNDPRAIIAECRAPLFLGVFWVFAGTVKTPRDLFYYGYLALCVLVVLAVVTIGAFAYFAVTGPIPNTQNALGEFVPRIVAGIPLQSIRPSGHAWFETALVVSLGMLLCPGEPWYRKAVYAGLTILFATAVCAGLMRTALVSVFVSITVLLWLSLPGAARALSFSVLLFAVGCAAFMALLNPNGAYGLPSFRDRSLNARAVETAGAIEAIRQQPLFGSGFGASFEALGLAQKDSASSAVPVDYRSLHNVWLYIAWKAGLVGLAMAVLALAVMLIYGQGIVTRLPTMSQRCLGRTLQAVLVGQLAASAAMPRLTYANGALFLGIWVMAMVLLEREAEGGNGDARSSQ
ncbi:MAG: O-antigen ligase family protein [Candidatus Hydrogenedentes bacterium]|nr:O-antigen ligase family protein [Candidatus Hydrogenedentota bacterium]